MSDSAGEKKYDLSDKRRQKLAEQGNIPRSQDVTTSTTLAVGLGTLVIGGGLLVGYLREMMTASFVALGHRNLEMSPQTFGALYLNGTWLWIGLFLGGLAVTVFVTQVSQVGINFTDDAFGPKFEKLNPLNGLKNIFSLNRLTQAGQNFIKLIIVTSFAWVAIKNLQNSPVFARPVSLGELGNVYVDVAWSLGWRIIMVLGVMAGADFGWQRWKFSHDNKMTEQEVKEERRSQEMSPEIMKKRRMMARKTSMRRMLDNLKDATIVVTNPTHYAVALRYRRGVDEIPVVVAKGIRMSALRIKEHAYDLRIPVREDRSLARGLYKYGRVDQPIPSLFYQAVAVILAQLFRRGFRQSEDQPTRTELTSEERAALYNTAND